MAQINIAVSIPNNYGIGGNSKPAFPKMHAHRWALKIEDLDPVMQASGEFNYVGYRHRYITDASVEDLTDDIDLNNVTTLLVIITGVVHARRDSDGTSWWADKAFVKKENAENYIKNINYSDSYLWVCAVEKLNG